MTSESSPWAHTPLDVLRAELQRRAENDKPQCGTKGGRGDYNTGLHVFALVLILVLSIAACSFPIIARRFPNLSIPYRFLFLSRHFGTGVLIATAFVHLLPTAFTSLTDPCLPKFWNKGYPAMPGLIAMSSVLVVVGIEMFFATQGAGHMHGSEYDQVPNEAGNGGHTHEENGKGRPGRTQRSGSFKRFSQAPIGENGLAIGLEQIGGASEQEAWSKEQDSTSRKPTNPFRDDANDNDNDSDLDLDELDPTSSNNANLLHSTQQVRRSTSSLRETLPPTPGSALSPQALERKLLLQCLLLEAGILFHSVFIGIAVSVSTGSQFIVLLIAISFHQTFEGLALGSRIAAIPTLTPKSPKPWLMALAYGTTTPIGQAIGLAVHGLYDPQGQMGLLMVGTMNAISSGLLLFAGLVELLAEDFLSDNSYITLYGRRRLEACMAVVGGAFLMALVGAWA